MCLESQPVFANDGSRAYTDFAFGTWLETVQVPLRIACFSESCISVFQRLLHHLNVAVKQTTKCKSM